eukprot:6463036-Pyramimonas_sp.AAC.1
MPAANPVLSPTHVQPLSHLMWARVLTSQSSFRAADKALHSALWIFFLRLILLRRAPPQTPPPRGG